MLPEEQRANLAALLREVAAEHHAWEQSVMPEGHPDPTWPEWYAEWLLDHGVELGGSYEALAAKTAG